MAGTVNVDKLKNDAFSAIDALFTDEGFTADGPEEQKEEGSPFARLEEYILALDWECTSKDIRGAMHIVDELLSSTEDKNTLTLLKILKNILVYLSRAGSNAHPETLGIAGEVVSGLTRISSKNDPRAEAKETRQLYERFKVLKQKISEYNQKMRKGAAPSGAKAAAETEAPQPESPERAASGQAAAPISESAPPSDVQEKLGAEVREDIKLIKKEIEHLGKRQSRLEDLVQRMFSEAESPARDSSFAPDAEKGLLYETAAEDTFDFASGDIDLGSGEEPSEEVPAQEEPARGGEGGSLENVAYVQIFKIGPDQVALPSEHINNIFKLSGKMRKKINSETTIPIKDFSSPFKKLSANMKGALRGTPEKELKKITAEVRPIGAGMENPKNAILCTCEHGQVLLPVTAPHSGNLFLVTEMQHEPNNYSQYTVQIDSLGNIPVYIPC